MPSEHHFRLMHFIGFMYKSAAKQNNVNQNSVVIKKMQMNRSQGDNMGLLKSTMRQMKKQQNMMKLRHEVWCEKSQTLIKSSLPKEPTMKFGMCLDISSYKKT